MKKNPLDSIIEYMEQIKNLELPDGITETLSEEENVLREDVVTPSFTQKQALANTSKKYGGYFMVDAIIEKE